jgi:DNA-binding Xre family transcriptional regulator
MFKWTFATQVELTRLKHGMDKWRRRTAVVKNVQNLKLSDDIDTGEVAEQVQMVLTRLGMSHKELAEKLGLTRVILDRLIKKPRPWSVIADATKGYYHKINAWLLDNKNLNDVCFVENYEDFDTSELAGKANALLKQSKMSKRVLAERLGLNEANLVVLIRFPRPWSRLSDAAKASYRKIRDWILEVGTDNNAKSEISIVLNKPFTNTPRQQSVTVDELNTVEVSRRMKELLTVYNIKYYYFAEVKLKTSKAHFEQLISAPRAWASLKKADRDLYRKMRKWTLATRCEFISLKETMQNWMRRRSLKSKLKRLISCMYSTVGK